MENMLSAQKLALVERTFLFQGINEIVVGRIILDPRCTTERFPKGSIVYDETHFRPSLGIVLSGAVLVDKLTSQNKRMKMSSLQPGDCFGAAAMFGQREQFATRLTAERNTEILFLTEDLIRWAMRRDFTITENYVRYLSDRIWFLNNKISDLTAGTTEQRLGMYLLKQLDTSEVLQSSMTDLSRQMNIGRASLYRALDTLEAAGAISRQGKTLQLLDKQILEQIAYGKE